MTSLLSALLFIVPAHAELNVDQVIQRDARDGVQVADVIRNADEVKNLSAVFDLKGRVLKPGEAIYMIVPPHLAQGLLDFASLTHSQHPDEENECRSADGRDCLPAYTSLEFFNDVDGRERGWRCWGGIGSGPCNSKFAEIRGGTPETDNLYEWTHKGHIGLGDGDEDRDRGRGGRNRDRDRRPSLRPLKPALMRVRSVGEDSAHIYRIILKTVPPRPTSQEEFIFAEGLSFGDFETARGRRYPGNPSMGDYGDALQLNRRSRPDHENLPSNWSVRNGSIQMPLKAGLRLSAVDIACGDGRPVPEGGDPEQYRGNAVVTIQWIRGNRVLETIMDQENVGTNGVMRASPADLSRKIEDGDALRIMVPKGEAKVMGIRLGYLEN